MTAVTVTRREGVLEVTLDRPPVNAIDAATSRELGEAFVMLRDDPALRVGLVTGGGRLFSAGWDLKAVDRGEEEGADYGAGGFAGLTEFWDLHKPVIAAVNGHAIGGGLELVLSCDLIVMSDTAEFGLPELEIGLLPDAGAIQRLPWRIPYNIAVEMILLGRRMAAREAAHYGLVNAVAKPADCLTLARAWADKIAGHAPLAVQALKELMHDIQPLPIEKRFAAVREGRLPTHTRMLHSEDRKEGIRAFIEKRKPRFFGR